MSNVTTGVETPRVGSASAAMLRRAAENDSTLYRPELALVRGNGAYLYDADDREYLDFAAGIGVASVGHANPRLGAAIAEQAARLLVCPQNQVNDVRTEFVADLIALAGAPLQRVFLSNSGTEANEAALKWARAATGRRQVVAAKRGFSGRTLGSLALTWEATYRKPFTPLDADVAFVAFNDLAALEAAVTDETAAVFLEPIQGEGGVHPASAEYLHLARQLTRDRGALLVLDEVQSGVGRSGAFLAAHGYGVAADIVTLAKGLGGGVPIGATLLTDAVARAMPTGGHGTTFGGNPLACAAGAAVLREIAEHDLMSNARVMGERLRAGLTAMASPRVRQVRGVGLMVGLELKQRAAPVVNGLRQSGLLTTMAGATVVRFLPPLMINAAQVDRAVELVAAELAA